MSMVLNVLRVNAWYHDLVFCLKRSVLKIDALFCMSCLGEPTSATHPLSTTIMVSKLKIFDILCAIDTTVLFDLMIRSLSICSELSSRLDVDSSIISIDESLRKALAMHSSWRWPALRFCPSSVIGSSKKLTLLSTHSWLRTVQIWSSVFSLRGSRFSLQITKVSSLLMNENWQNKRKTLFIWLFLSPNDLIFQEHLQKIIRINYHRWHTQEDRLREKHFSQDFVNFITDFKLSNQKK